MSIKPDYAEAYNNMGIIFLDQGKVEEALKVFSKAVSIKRTMLRPLVTWVWPCMSKENLEAIKNLEKAISIAPDYIEAYLNKGVILKAQGNIEAALKTYNEALSIKPNDAEIQYNNSFLKLQTDEWKKGIELQKWRWKTKEFEVYQRFFEAPEWDGQVSPEGNTLLVWCEQGPGDIIIWCAC